ncbi:DUF5305 family protein [Desulfosporosinus nitroreducens]|uniref:DUF5305 family protein n=1 Tax=Desulfosporosinus nitroreducens TaxID=2018668 RepID=UPI00207C4D0F|nr:DUF5305 family protein [Desulfosporosinus nitroreducens]MCO1600937.1 DUF5305 domain-containing protein [Desulfosporosinus nitroreducens]
MRKGQIRKDIRLGSIILCMAILGVSLTLLSFKFINPGFNENMVPLYSYESQGKVNYEVTLKPNSLYDKKSLGEDQVYLSNLVDFIDTTYSYNFTGERVAEVKGNYEIVAVIEGYIGEGDRLTTLWRKEIPVLANNNFSIKDKTFSITKKMSLKLQDFNDIVQKISEESKVTAQTKVTASMNVVFDAKTDKGEIKKTSESSIEIPLAGSYFMINKKQGENLSEAIEEVKLVPRAVDTKLLTLGGTGIGIVVVALLILIFKTQSVEENVFDSKLKKIFKRHGTRLVALSSEIAPKSELQSRVRSMEDLVKISDELLKPIVYKHSDNDKENSKFWVIDEDRFYFFQLEVPN